MTVTTTGRAAGLVTEAVRRHVRNRLEESRRSYEVQRTALLEEFDAAGSATETAALGRAIAIAGYRIAAIEDHLLTAHDPHPDEGICGNCCVLVDSGQGPKWLLLAALSEDGLPLIASDSALGRALIGARPGESVDYPDPTGLRTVHVLSLEPAR